MRVTLIRCATRRPHSFVALAATLFAATLLQAGPSGAAPSAFGHVRGIVVTTGGERVQGATVTLPSFGLSAISGVGGWFSFAQGLPAALPYRRISAVVRAPGWGTWTIRGVPLYPDDTLELRAELSRSPVTHDVLTPAERAARTRAQAPAPPAGPPRSTYTSTCTGWDYQQVVPPKIWVYLTKDKKSKQYDFVFYATHVLPQEWISNWDRDALGAGAVAVKTYGAYRAMSGHAYSGGTGCADITDWTSDQVFDPTWSTAATDQAVYATLGSTLKRNGQLFLTNYWSGVSKDDKCQQVTTAPYTGWMSQWGSQNCAKAGKLWPDIDQVFYTNTAWYNLKQLLLDPDVDSAATYAWTWDPAGGVTRTKGGAYDGSYSFTLKPSGGGNVALRERRPFLGQSADTYHSEVALRCLTTNSNTCTIILNVVAVDSSGTFHIKARTVTEARDGAWRVYTFDPAAFGVDHVEVKLSIVSSQTVGVDAAVLTGPFGGP